MLTECTSLLKKEQYSGITRSRIVRYINIDEDVSELLVYFGHPFLVYQLFSELRGSLHDQRHLHCRQ